MKSWESGVYQKFLPTIAKNDLVPLGDWETVPVEITSPTMAYPHVVPLDFKFSTTQLMADFTAARPVLMGAREFFESRDEHLIGATWEEAMSVIIDLGFTKEKYAACNMRKPGTNLLQDCIPGYTRKALAATGPNFRQIYVVAKGHWCSKPHIDNEDFAMHGFKIHLPLRVDGYIGYLAEDGIRIYKLKAGTPYFCNTATPHFGLNPLDEDRPTILYQLASDRAILAGRPLDPINETPEIRRSINWLEDYLLDFKRSI